MSAVVPLDVFQPWADRIRECRRCELRGEVDEPVPGWGNVDAKVMVVGEYPAGDEPLLGRPFEERAGLLLKKAMRLGGLKHEECFLTLAVRCAPEGRVPARCWHECRGWLWQEIKAVRPRVIVTLGDLPTRVLLRRTVGAVKLDDVAGMFFDLPFLPGAVAAPWYSPSYMLQRGKKFEERTVRFFEAVATRQQQEGVVGV